VEITTASSDSTNPSLKKTSISSKTPLRPLTNMKSLGLYQRKRRKNSLRSSERKLPRVVRSVKLVVVDGTQAGQEAVTAGDEGAEEGVVAGVAGAAAMEGPGRMAVQKKKRLRRKERKLRQAKSGKGRWNQMGRPTLASEGSMHLLPSKLPSKG
jgi:hypothetical protein